MDQNAALHRARWQKMTDFFTVNSAKVSAATDVAAMVAAWTPKIAQWDAKGAAAAGAGVGAYGGPKLAAKTAAAELACKWGRRCAVAAHQLGLYAVEHTIDHRSYEIVRMKDAEALEQLHAMYGALSNNITALASIVTALTSTVVTSIQTRNAAFEALLPKPGEAVDTREALNGQMAQMMADMDGELDQIVMLLEAEYEDSAPDFVLALMVNNELGKSSGRRATGLQGTVKDGEGQPKAGFKIVCTELNKEAMADLMGAYTIPSMKGGLHLFELHNDAGAVVKSDVLRIKPGVTLVKDWVVA